MKQFTPEATIPGDIKHLIDENVRATYDELYNISYDEMKAAMPEPQLVKSPDDSQQRVAILPGAEAGDYSDVIVLNLEHQQPWNVNHYVKARVLQAVVAPDKPLIVMPNNGFRDTYYDLTASELKRIKAGSIDPIAEQQAVTLETLGVETVATTGYSWGGRLAVALAAFGPDFAIRAVNADEAPSKVRSTRQLEKDFLASGGFGDQQQAMRQSGLASMHESTKAGRMLFDYAKFGISSRANGHSRAVSGAMATSIESDIEAAREAFPDMTIKLGHVAGSKLFDPETVADITGIRVVEYGPVDQYQGHTSANNAFIHAIMAKDGNIR